MTSGRARKKHSSWVASDKAKVSCPSSSSATVWTSCTWCWQSCVGAWTTSPILPSLSIQWRQRSTSAASWRRALAGTGRKGCGREYDGPVWLEHWTRTGENWVQVPNKAWGSLDDLEPVTTSQPKWLCMIVVRINKVERTPELPLFLPDLHFCLCLCVYKEAWFALGLQLVLSISS